MLYHTSFDFNSNNIAKETRPNALAISASGVKDNRTAGSTSRLRDFARRATDFVAAAIAGRGTVGFLEAASAGKMVHLMAKVAGFWPQT